MHTHQSSLSLTRSLFQQIHAGMSGRIKLLKNGVPVNEVDDPPIYEYEYYDVPEPFDQACGTFGLQEFQLPNSQCPAAFICDALDKSQEYQYFTGCIDATNCHMFAGMTTGTSAGSEIGLFIHQMIPHHQNAVNMAKSVLAANALQCDNIDSDTDDCQLERILRMIVNTQNHQIQSMQSVLEMLELPEADNCVLDVKSKLADSSAAMNVVLEQLLGAMAPLLA